MPTTRSCCTGLVIPMTYDAQREQTDFTPVWTLKSTYTWEANFPAGKTVEVEHSYTPSVGGTVPPPSSAAVDTTDQDRRNLQDKYCTDDTLIKPSRSRSRTGRPLQRPLLRELDLLHLVDWRNWSGAIHKFHLTIDKATPRT